jgi:CubicO group peptidase (beta-lactamase class C family)
MVRLFLGWVPVLFLLVVSCGSGSDQASESSTGQPAAEALPPDSAAWYDSTYAPARAVFAAFFDSLARINQFNGSYLVLKNGYVIARGNHGYAVLEDKKPIADSTAFQIASMSKPMTAICIMQLVADGKMSLDDTLGTFFPGFPYHGIRVKHLLAHRGGLGNYMYFTEKLWKDSINPMRNKDMVQFMLREKPKRFWPPDTRFDYSNTGYALLASIVEKVSGMPFKDYICKHVFEPAGMEHAFLVEPLHIPAHAAHGYSSNGREPGNNYLNGVYGDKGVYATMNDLNAFAQAVIRGKLLPDSLMQVLKTPANPIESDSTTYGYGFRLVYPGTANQIVHHTGWFQGFRGNLIMQEQRGLVVIWNTNYVQGPFHSPKTMVKLADMALRRVKR